MTPSEAKAAEKRLRASAEWRAQSDGHDQEYRNFVEAADALASMIAEVERLTKERDEYKTGWEKDGEEYRKLRDSILSLIGEFK